MTISATDMVVPVCFKTPLLCLLTQKTAQKFGYVLGIKKDSNGLQVCIADNGWGISKKDQKLIFKQFYRVPHEHGPRGHGIGLALVKYVVESHGGHILVKSEVGKGSKFIFNIPSI